MSNAKILVVLPTLGDRLDTLAETLDSIDAQRADVDVTLVVIAPVVATDARALAAAHGAVLVDDPRQGVSAAINRGLTARSDEEFYAWIGDDDLFRPGGLKTLQHLLEGNPASVLAYGGCEYIAPSGAVLALSNAGWLAKVLLPWGPDLIPHPGTMIRLDALQKIGGFDESLKYAMDLDAFLKLRSHGKFSWTRKPVSAFRWHPDSLTVANRLGSSRESEAVKTAHLPRALRSVSPVWNYPMRWAASVAARAVSARAR